MERSDDANSERTTELMHRMPWCASVAGCSLLVWLCTAGPAHAYLDPGVGSYIFQVLIASAMAALFGVKLFWGRIKRFFRGESEPDPAARPDASGSRLDHPAGTSTPADKEQP